MTGPTSAINVYLRGIFARACTDPTLGDPDTPHHYYDSLEKVNPANLYGTFYAGLDIGKQVDHSVLAVIQKLTATAN